MGRFSAVVFGVVMLAAACCAVAAGTAVPAGASPQPAGLWGTAQPVPGLAALNAGGAATVESVSCGSAGNCAAAGTYTDSADHVQAFVADEVNWSWGAAEEVPGLAALTPGVNAGSVSVSCGSAGNCAAIGAYTDSSGHSQPFVVAESGGSWGTAQQVPGLAALDAGGNADVLLLSCAPGGYCAAVGFYFFTESGVTDQFVVDETGGTWSTVQLLPGPDGGAASVSCPSAGNCLVGDDGDVVAESGGSWGTAQPVPGLAALAAGGSGAVSSVSCASAGNCTVVGTYTDTSSLSELVFGAEEVNGSWGTAEQLPGTAALDLPGAGYLPMEGGLITVASLSCSSPGNCTAAGWIPIELEAADDPSAVFVADEVNGSWEPAQLLPGTGGGPIYWQVWGVSVSCGSPGNCVAGGVDGDYAYPSPFLAQESGGSWAAAQAPPGLAALNTVGGDGADEVLSVSCAPSGNCAAGGQYTDSAGEQGFVMDEKPSTSTVVALSAARVTYGNEQAERVSAAVSAASGGTPAGTVTVQAGTAVLCGNLTLAAARTACTVPATRLPAGTWQLTAAYSGSPGLAASTSAAQALTVARAAAKITLALSAAKVTYGKEQAERLTVRVTGQYGLTPAGKVTVKSGKTTVCTITLTAGKGSCTLAARKLAAGTRILIAVYSGNGDFAGASSARKTLKVVP